MIIRAIVVPRLPNIALGSPNVCPVRAATRLWPRNDWLGACTVRLSQLCPERGVSAMASAARSLWLDVAAFDPVIAAEMEYETWLAGDEAGGPAAMVSSL